MQPKMQPNYVVHTKTFILCLRLPETDYITDPTTYCYYRPLLEIWDKGKESSLFGLCSLELQR